MRLSSLAVVSTVHLPVEERVAIAALIAAVQRSRSNQPMVVHTSLTIEPHRSGFFVNTEVVLDDERPGDISAELWEILSRAERAGCDWVLFDRDEVPYPLLPRFG